MEITNLLEFSHRAQLREWFEQHATTDKECWIAMYRVRRPAECGDCLPYIDVVAVAAVSSISSYFHTYVPVRARTSFIV